MKRILFFLFWFLLLVSVAHAQKPRLSIHADVGGSRTFINYYDAYANPYQKNHSLANLGASLRIRISRGVSFDPEVGVGGYGMTYLYRNSKSIHSVDSRLLLVFGQIAPMLTLHPNRHIGIGAGFSVMTSCFTLGKLIIHTYYNGEFSQKTYTDHLNKLRNPVLWGPRILVQAMFPTTAGREIGFRLGSFLSLNSVFQKYAHTGINPRFVQVFAGISYAFAPRK